MSHPGIDTRVDAGAHRLKDLRGFLDAADRDVWIDVAAAQKHRRAVERTGVVARGPWRTDQASAQPDHRCVTPRMTRGELERQAGALRKPEQPDPIRADACRDSVRDDAVKGRERVAQMR